METKVQRTKQKETVKTKTVTQLLKEEELLAQQKYTERKEKRLQLEEQRLLLEKIGLLGHVLGETIIDMDKGVQYERPIIEGKIRQGVGDKLLSLVDKL